MTSPTVAVTPMRGGATVIASTMNRLSRPPIQSQTGSCSAAPRPVPALDDEEQHEPPSDDDDRRERDRRDDPDPIAELAHHRRLDRARRAPPSPTARPRVRLRSTRRGSYTLGASPTEGSE